MYYGKNERRSGTSTMEQAIHLSKVPTIPDSGQTALRYLKYTDQATERHDDHFRDSVGREATGTGELESKAR